MSDGFCVLYACYYEIDVINFDLERAEKRISNYRDTTIYICNIIILCLMDVFPNGVCTRCAHLSHLSYSKV